MARRTWTRVAYALGFAAALAIGVSVTGACNDTGTCPAKSAITPGASCDNDDLQCPYDLATPSAACDGTSTTITTSCICSQGSWQCPAAFTCDAGASGDDAAEAGGDDAAESGGDDAADAGGGDAPAG
jgi:hypothetical protein